MAVINCQINMKSNKDNSIKRGRVFSVGENRKIAGNKYHYMHSMDSIIWVVVCDHCKQEVGGWTPKQRDERWSEHCC